RSSETPHRFTSNLTQYLPSSSTKRVCPSRSSKVSRLGSRAARLILHSYQYMISTASISKRTAPSLHRHRRFLRARCLALLGHPEQQHQGHGGEGEDHHEFEIVDVGDHQGLAVDEPVHHRQRRLVALR